MGHAKSEAWRYDELKVAERYSRRYYWIPRFKNRVVHPLLSLSEIIKLS